MRLQTTIRSKYGSTGKEDSAAQVHGMSGNETEKDMMRVLKTAEGQIVLDTTGRKNGRGAYLCRSMSCFEQAVKNKGLEPGH